jgi:anti-anti-sigma factor
MERPYRQIDVQRAGDVVCVRLRQRRMDEAGVYEFGDDLLRLIEDEGCRKLVISLGPEPPECLYSILLAKLVTAQKRMQAHQGVLKIANAGPDTIAIFEACRLKDLFDFSPGLP